MCTLIRTQLGSIALAHWIHQDPDTFPKVDTYHNIDRFNAQKHWTQSLPIDFSPFKPQDLKSPIHQTSPKNPMKRLNTVHEFLFLVLEQQPKFQLFAFVGSPNPTIPFLIRNPIIFISYYFLAFYLDNSKSSKSKMSKAELGIPNLIWLCSLLR